MNAFLPIEYKFLNQIDEDITEFEQVKFLDNWGPFEKAQKVEFLTINLDTNTVEEWTLDGKCLKTVHAKLVVDEANS